MARTPVHPGEILADELEETGLSAKKLADVIQVPPNRLYQLLAGKRSMTADTALRLSQYFGMAPDFWMDLQSAYELDLVRQKNGKAIQRIPRRSETAEPRPVA
jgi:addiction module HigA family antidote